MQLPHAAIGEFQRRLHAATAPPPPPAAANPQVMEPALQELLESVGLESQIAKFAEEGILQVSMLPRLRPDDWKSFGVKIGQRLQLLDLAAAFCKNDETIPEEEDENGDAFHNLTPGDTTVTLNQ